MPVDSRLLMEIDGVKRLIHFGDAWNQWQWCIYTGRLSENTVYLQLLYEGWSVHVSKLYGKEVDFVATKDGRVLSVQATDEMFASETKEREIAPLKSIRDSHEKIVVVRRGSYDTGIDGIRIVSARDFFL